MSGGDFIKRLELMLENTDGSIFWDKNGTEFTITSIEKFENSLLPKYYRHRKLESFIRQLNMYGFNKLTRQKNSMSFRNKLFTKQNGQNHSLIKRKKSEDILKQIEDQVQKNVIDSIDSSISKNPQITNLFEKLLKIRTQTNSFLKKTKLKIDALSREVSTKISKQIQPHIRNIRSSINFMEQKIFQFQLKLVKEQNEHEKEENIIKEDQLDINSLQVNELNCDQFE